MTGVQTCALPILTEAMQVKKIAFLEGVFEGVSSNASKPAKDEAFDADVAIATGELGKLFPDLLAALGGELIRDASTPDTRATQEKSAVPA